MLLPSKAAFPLEEVCTMVVMLVLGWTPGLQWSGHLCSVRSGGAGLVSGLEM